MSFSFEPAMLQSLTDLTSLTRLFQQEQFVGVFIQASVFSLNSPITLLHLATSEDSFALSLMSHASEISLSHLLIFLNTFMPSIAFVSLYLPAQIGALFVKDLVPPNELAKSVKLAFVLLLLFPLFPARVSRLSILFFCWIKFCTVSLFIFNTCSKLFRHVMF